MAFDVRQFLKDMKFSDAQIEEMAPKFGADQIAAAEAGYVAANDRASIAAARSEIQNQQAQLKAANDKLNAEIAEWATLTSEEKAQSTELRDSLDKSQQRILALEQSLTRLATTAGVDPKTVIPAAEKVETPVVKPAAVDTSKFVERDQFGTLMQFAVDLPAQLQFIADEHKELTGQRLDTRAIVAEIKKRAGQKDAVTDPVRIWEEMNDIPAKRTARDAAARAAEIKAAEERGEERARSNMAIPGASTTTSRRPSPVLSPRGTDGQVGPRTSVLKRPQPETGVMAAAAALRSHKYAEKVS